jgi:beta-N-acetylhexosaminidase
MKPSDSGWAESILSGLSLDEAIGQLLCPDNKHYTTEDWKRIFEEIPLGSVFSGRQSPEDWQEMIDAVQSSSQIPCLVAADFERGPHSMYPGCTDFPYAMAVGAANDPKLAESVGKASALEGRSRGIHWNLSPVVDLAMEFRNPVINLRAISDQPDRVASLACAWIKGIQGEGLMAAAAKHFPGEGTDERDSHLCTTVNRYTLEEWWNLFGVVWKRVIEAGVMSIMCGHVSLPAYEGFNKSPEAALPATLSSRLQVDLLRGELGFKGVVVSDACRMLGMTTRVSTDKSVVENIRCGSDVYLFADPIRDFKRLRRAVHDKFLSEERVYEAASRVLALKERLRLHQSIAGNPPAEEQLQGIRSDAKALSERAVTLIRSNEHTPLSLSTGDRVASIMVQYSNEEDSGVNWGFLEQELTSKGLLVDSFMNPTHDEIQLVPGDYAAVFVNFYVVPHSLVGTIRMTGPLVAGGWKTFWINSHTKKLIFTSFGNPYVLHEIPALPNLYVTYGASRESQRAAVNAWLGSIIPNTQPPTRMPRISLIDPNGASQDLPPGLPDNP